MTFQEEDHRNIAVVPVPSSSCDKLTPSTTWRQQFQKQLSSVRTSLRCKKQQLKLAKTNREDEFEVFDVSVDSDVDIAFAKLDVARNAVVLVDDDDDNDDDDDVLGGSSSSSSSKDDYPSMLENAEVTDEDLASLYATAGPSSE